MKQIKGVITVLKEFMKNDDNVSQVKTWTFWYIYIKRQSLCMNRWWKYYLRWKRKNKRCGLQASKNTTERLLRMWNFEIKRPVSGCVTDDNVEEKSKNKEWENPQNTYNMKEDATFGAVHVDIQPNNSISNVGSWKYGLKTGISRTSINFCFLFSCQNRSQNGKERFKLEVEIAAAQAKMDVLRVSGSSVKGIRCNESMARSLIWPEKLVQLLMLRLIHLCLVAMECITIKSHLHLSQWSQVKGRLLLMLDLK